MSDTEEFEEFEDKEFQKQLYKIALLENDRKIKLDQDFAYNKSLEADKLKKQQLEKQQLEKQQLEKQQLENKEVELTIHQLRLKRLERFNSNI